MNLRVLLLLLILLGMGLLWFVAGSDGLTSKAELLRLQNPVFRFGIYFIFCIASSFITLPLGIFTKLLGGWVLGFIPGFLTGLFGILLGSYLAFRFARYTGREALEKKYAFQLGAMNERFKVDSFLTVVRLRLFPFFPLQILNYLLGLSKVSERNFVLGSLLGMMPATLMYAWAGSQIVGLAEGQKNTYDFLPIHLFLLTAFVMSLLIRQKSHPMDYSQEIQPILENLWKKASPHKWDEQAIPSYLHSNPIVRHIFWKRIRSSYAAAAEGATVLDFGCGAGAMLPWLVRGYKSILCFDTNKDSSESLKNTCQLKNWQQVKVLSVADFTGLESASVDTIFALDVLEHVEHLPALLLEFRRILKPQGRLVVSSPTENWIYKLVRKFAGPGYQGEYHLRAAKEVETDLAQVFDLQLVTRIFPVFTFFRIVTATQGSRGGL